MRLAHPWLLALLLLVGLILLRERHRRRDVEVALAVPETATLRAHAATWRTWLARLLPPLELVALILTVVILARPQSEVREREVVSEGIDIILAIDVSGSMKAEDFKPNRLTAAKDVAKDFVSDRRGDRIGLVVFAREAFSQCPPTFDYSVLRRFVSESRLAPDLGAHR